MEEKYVKFIDGECDYLTGGKPYLAVLLAPKKTLWKITDDMGALLYIIVDKERGCAHIRFNKWYFCDKNGNLTE